MRAVTGVVTSSNPISLSKAATVISHFAASKTGARPDVAAYLRRTASEFNELVAVRREIRARSKSSHVEVTESVTQDDDNSRWRKKKKKKENYYEEDAGTSILDPKKEMGRSSLMKVEGFDSEKKSEGRRYWKENMRKEDRLQEVDEVGLVSESKKRKRSHAEEGEANGGMEQHEGKKKCKRRTVE